MPEANLTTFDLSDKTPGELEQRRRAIVKSLTTDYRGYDDENVPRELLQELAVVTATLRRKNSGPPKKVKVPSEKSSKPKTVNEVLDLLN